MTRHHAVRGVLLALAGIALVSILPRPFVKTVGAQGPDRVDVIIAFRTAPGPADEALVAGAGGRIRHTYHLVPAIAANLPQQAVAALLANPRVAAVEPDVRVFAIDAEADNTWGVKRIGAPSVHTNGIRGTGIKVAVIDTGIDRNHPDLAANYAGGFDFINNDADPSDDNKHGTHVAGTIGARDDDVGVVGVAPEVRLYALKVLGADGSGSFSDVIAALQWAVDNGLQVTNNSYGSNQDPGTTTKAAFDNAAAAGLLHVAAAGNSGNCFGTGDSVSYPARYDSVIAVAATDQTDSSPCFSSTGPSVELAAPGVAINSTIPGGAYEALTGTSMASPHVAGTAALVLSAGVADTNANGRVNDEVRQILDSTAQDLGAAGRDTWYGFGLVDAVAAVASAGPPAPAVNVSVTTDKTTYTSGVDTTAQLTAVVRNEQGTAITGATFVTTLDGTAATVDFTPTATPGTFTGSLNISGAAVGSHTVVVTATDTARAISGNGSKAFDVVPLNTVRVSEITYSTYGGWNGKRHLLIAVWIVDGTGAPVSGATVSVIVTRNGSFYGAANGTSGSDGKALFEARNAPSGCYTTTVAAVIAGTRTWDETTPPNQFCK
jgi:subtilisin family serine protease